MIAFKRKQTETTSQPISVNIVSMFYEKNPGEASLNFVTLQKGARRSMTAGEIAQGGEDQSRSSDNQAAQLNGHPLFEQLKAGLRFASQ